MENRHIEEFMFRCEACRREFLFRDNRLFERTPQRDMAAEVIAIRELEHVDALHRRCFDCGGPLTADIGGFRCQWCDEPYVIRDGQLIPKPYESQIKPKARISDFYALQQ